ncbi:MAG: M15 family metallopeptidase [Bacteroidales bacterium]|nr:M15 family metallopeptidase [Bacteroidales bacterium]
MRRFYFILLLFITVFGSNAQTASNPYNLPLVNSMEAYKALVLADSSNSMIDLEAFIPSIVLDIRYAGSHNFTRQKIYTHARAFVRRPVAKALLKVQQSLDSIGLGLKIYDAYRPYQASLKFFEVYPDTSFVAAPWQGSRHNRGAAVDVSLIDKKSRLEVQMPTKFDDFSAAAAPDYNNLPDEARHNRKLLIDVMKKHGFSVYPTEWWHFDFQGWEKFGLLDLSFEQLDSLFRAE